MEQADTTKSAETPIEAPDTVKELLSHIEDGKYATLLGEGNHAVAYRFKPIKGLERDGDQEGIDEFVIRVPTKHSLTEALENSTSLTPADQVLHQLHVGNRLMNLDFAKLGPAEKAEALAEPVSVHLFQDGENLGSLYHEIFEEHKKAHLFDESHLTEVVKKRRENRANCPRMPGEEELEGEPHVITSMRAVVDIVKHIKKIVDACEAQGFNPYNRMFKKIYVLGKQGFEADLFMKNILYNEKLNTLRLVDQENRSLDKDTISDEDTKSNLEIAANLHKNEFDLAPNYNVIDGKEYARTGLFNLRKNLREEGKVIDPELEKKYHEARRYMKTLIDKAKQAALTSGKDWDEKDIAPGLPQIPQEVSFKSVEGAQAVALSHTPKALLEQLRYMRKTADIVR